MIDSQASVISKYVNETYPLRHPELWNFTDYLKLRESKASPSAFCKILSDFNELLIFRYRINLDNGYFVTIPFIVDTTIQNCSFVLGTFAWLVLKDSIQTSELDYQFIEIDNVKHKVVINANPTETDDKVQSSNVITGIGLYKILSKANPWQISMLNTESVSEAKEKMLSSVTVD
jgi:hypothetical protein